MGSKASSLPTPSPHLVLTTKNCLMGSKLPPHSSPGWGQVLTHRAAVRWAEAQSETLMCRVEVSSLQLSKGRLGPHLVEELAENSCPSEAQPAAGFVHKYAISGSCLGSLWHRGQGQAALRYPGGRGKGRTRLSRLGLDIGSLATGRRGAVCCLVSEATGGDAALRTKA